MSYEKQNFIKGQILKADHLNYMEDGISQLSEEIENKQPAGNYVKTINGSAPDANGNVQIAGDGSTVVDLRVPGGIAPRDVYNPDENTIDDAQNESYILSSGAIRQNGGSDRGYFVTGKLTVKPEKTYTIHGSLFIDAQPEVNRGRAYSAVDAALTALVWGADADGNITFTTPANAAYVRFAVNKTAIGYSQTTMLPELICRFNSIFALTVPADTFDADAYLDKGAIKKQHLNADTLPLGGKTIVNFGDSIFGNYCDKAADISTFLAEYAAQRSSIVRSADAEWLRMSFPAGMRGACTGLWTASLLEIMTIRTMRFLTILTKPRHMLPPLWTISKRWIGAR